MKKKIVSMLCLPLTLSLLFAGCGKESAKEPADSGSPTASSASSAASSSASSASSSSSASNDTDDADALTPVTLNEVAHSIFYAPMYVAIEEGYFEEEGIDLTLVTGFGADKVLTALISGEADIGFMGPESSIYAYLEGANDVVVNFAQLTQRAGNFVVAREPMADFKWDDLKGKNVLGGRKGGMPGPVQPDRAG